MVWLRLDRCTLWPQRLIKAGTDQAQLAGLIIRVALQIERMLHKSKLTQDQDSCQERGCEPIIHRLP